jgi:predicted phosphate transport protein (TIGR00153 family)
MQELTMNAFDMIAEPICFARQLHEHAHKVHQSVDLVPSLVDALLTGDYEKIRTLHEQMSRISDEASQTKLSLFDQIKNMQFHSVGGYAFSQYLACQDKIADVAQKFAALLVLRGTTIPDELHADFRAFAAQVAHVCEQTATLAESVSSPPESVPPATEAQNTLAMIQGIVEGNRHARQLGMQLARCACRLQERLSPVTVLFLDKYCATLYEAADNAEHTANHLRLMIR